MKCLYPLKAHRAVNLSTMKHFGMSYETATELNMAECKDCSFENETERNETEICTRVGDGQMVRNGQEFFMQVSLEGGFRYNLYFIHVLQFTPVPPVTCSVLISLTG